MATATPPTTYQTALLLWWLLEPPPSRGGTFVIGGPSGKGAFWARTSAVTPATANTAASSKRMNVALPLPIFDRVLSNAQRLWRCCRHGSLLPPASRNDRLSWRKPVSKL